MSTDLDQPATTGLPVFADVPPGAHPLDASVHIDGFRLAVLPTTVAQYWHYLVDEGLHENTDPELHGFPATAGTGLRTTPGGSIEFDEGCAGLPVTWVTWAGAMAYCAWLSARTGTTCRLPSAAEWHYASSGAAGHRYALGNDFDRDLYAPPVTEPRPVAAMPANPSGLRGMTGNVFEWCSDPLLDAESALPLGSRVIKGGAWTVRNPGSFDNATVFTADEASCVPYIGFRVVSEA